MRHLQAAAFIVLVALISASCSATATVSIDENAYASASRGTTAQDRGLAEPSSTTASEPTTAADDTPEAQTIAAQRTPQEKNEAARYDRFVMETFAGASDSELGVLNFAVSAYCLGVLDSQMAERLPIDQRWHEPLTSIDDSTCQEIEVHSFMIRTEPTGATTWDDAVRMRFERVVWWGDLVDFERHAIRVCNDLPSSLDMDPGFELSTSAEIELADMVSEECRLMFNDPAPSGVVLDEGAVALDFWLYYTSFGIEVEGPRQPRNLWRVNAKTGEQQMLVDTGANEHGGVQYSVQLSPDRSQIAYAINEGTQENGYSELGLFVADIDGSNAVRIGQVAENSPRFWSDDGTELISNDGDYNSHKFIVAFDVKTLSKRVVAEDVSRDLWLHGVVAGSIYYSSNDGNNQYRFYRADLETGQESDVLDVGYVGWRVDPVTRTAVFSDSSQEDIGRVGIVDLTTTPMKVVDVPTPHGYNKSPKISPSGTYISFANGLEQFGDATALVAPLDNPAERLNIESVFTTGEGGAWIWTPDSRGLIVTNGEPRDREAPRQQPMMYVVSLGLEVTELAAGTPAAILAN